jgi:hypothetical protein
MFNFFINQRDTEKKKKKCGVSLVPGKHGKPPGAPLRDMGATQHGVRLCALIHLLDGNFAGRRAFWVVFMTWEDVFFPWKMWKEMWKK